jgi:GxxExxY protein
MSAKVPALTLTPPGAAECPSTPATPSPGEKIADEIISNIYSCFFKNSISAEPCWPHGTQRRRGRRGRKMTRYQHEKITQEVISSAIEIHKTLGPGLLESAYKTCLLLELQDRGLRCRQELPIPILYKHHRIDCGFRMDLFVEEEVIVELKAIEHILPIHEAQLLTYLRLVQKQVGLLINFNVPLLKNGIRRCVLNAHEEKAEEPEWIKF